ncbi:MAG: hypothetical protein EOO60_13325 [Hymenobacter sp.]|nr:MAG: hypothetical protein EOO60_13325 [Hymenobacter sp.]
MCACRGGGTGTAFASVCRRDVVVCAKQERATLALWWVENVANGQVVAAVVGRRTHATFRRLLALLSGAGWAVAQWFTDAWGAYGACLPADQHLEAIRIG